MAIVICMISGIFWAFFDLSRKITLKKISPFTLLIIFSFAFCALLFVHCFLVLFFRFPFVVVFCLETQRPPTSSHAVRGVMDMIKDICKKKHKKYVVSPYNYENFGDRNSEMMDNFEKRHS